jgi:hypothetical protein
MQNRNPFSLPFGQGYGQLPPEVLSLATPLNVLLGILKPEIVQNIGSQLRGRVLMEGQFCKPQVAYTPVALALPVAYVYDCADCRFYRQSSKTCELVAGNIEPYAWCGLWLPKSNDQPFSWIGRAWK